MIFVDITTGLKSDRAGWMPALLGHVIPELNALFCCKGTLRDIRLDISNLTSIHLSHVSNTKLQNIRFWEG